MVNNHDIIPYPIPMQCNTLLISPRARFEISYLRYHPFVRRSGCWICLCDQGCHGKVVYRAYNQSPSSMTPTRFSHWLAMNISHANRNKRERQGNHLLHPQITSRHKTTRFTQKKNCCPPKLFRPTHSPQHILLRPFDSSLWKSLEQFFYHVCQYVSWADSVDADPVWTPFRRKIACQLDDTSFGCVVGWTDQATVRDGAGHGGDEDDRTGGRGRDHGFCGCLCGHKTAGYVNGEHRIGIWRLN